MAVSRYNSRGGRASPVGPGPDRAERPAWKRRTEKRGRKPKTGWVRPTWADPPGRKRAVRSGPKKGRSGGPFWIVAVPKLGGQSEREREWESNPRRPF